MSSQNLWDMVTKRKTSNDYRKELKELKDGMVSLESHINERLMELCKIYPDAVILKKSVDEYKAKSLTKLWIESVAIETRISYIESIEKWSSELQNVRQLEIPSE